MRGLLNRRIRLGALGVAGALVAASLAGATTRPAGRTDPVAIDRGPAGQLKVTARIDLGAYPQAVLDGMVFAEAPDDTVYFAAGSVVQAIRGNEKPLVVLDTAGPVLALAATNGDLYVQVGVRVTEYAVPRVVLRKSWTLPHAAMKPTSAGLFPSSGVLWSWSDWATDESGFEYATVVAISPSTSSAKIVDDHAYPDDMAASPAGLYYETVVGTKNHLVRATANGGRELSAPTTDSDAPLALGPGYLAVFAMKGAGLPYVDEFSANTLAVLHSSRLAVNTSAVLGTAGGVLAIESACSGYVCPSAKVVRVDAADGAETNGVPLPDAQRLLGGTHPAAIAEVMGRTYLVRLS